MTEKICYTIERHVSGISLAGTIKYAPVAQLDRALDSDSKGRWFESSRAHHVAASGLPFAAIFLKSPRAHLAAAPFQIEPASPDFDLVSGANL